MSILDKLDNGVTALVRTARHGRVGPEWGEPFVCSLYLQKDKAGRTCVLALQDRDFAEFDPRNQPEGNLLFETEDYLLEILEVPHQPST